MNTDKNQITWDVEVLDPSAPSVGKHPRRFTGDYPTINHIRAHVEKMGLEFFRGQAVNPDITPPPAVVPTKSKPTNSAKLPTPPAA